MASYTSAQSGYWSDPTTWSPQGFPKEGDTVTIAAGHTVILDTDLSGFPNGLAALTINGTLLIPSLNDPNYQEVGEETSGTPWLEGWSYRRTVIVDNSFSSTSLTGFQIIIRLNTAYLIQQGKMREDCGDIRVTDSNGNLLPIWIDPDTKNMWNTKVYVKVPSIPANGTVTLYLFYGNPSATDISDPNAVFDFFDDFSGTTLDTTKWTAARWTGTGTWSVTVGNGYVEIVTNSGTRAGIVSKTAFPFPFIVEGKFLYVSGDQVWNTITQANGGSHSDLVEHGYDNWGGRYTYRKASGGSYTNYQQFSRYAPRGVFANFRIEWLTNASRYYEWDIQVNSTTTQDRYTTGSCYIQLSTYAGTARWDWIAVRKYAATPPAVYFRTLSTVALKVNANIAGSGSFLVGSASYAITYPQTVRILVNGTISTATVNIYGEQRSPLWDYLAADADAGSTTIVLQNGLPLRAGDLIAIGRSDFVGYWYESGSARGLHTVASYNSETKTVTLNEALTHARSGTGVRACLVILLSRQVVISKYGANNVTLLSGSGRTIQGVLFQAESGATVHSATTASSSTFTYCSHIGFGGNNGAFHTTSNITISYHTGYTGGGYTTIRDPTGTNTITNSAFINSSYGIFWFIHTSSTWTLDNIHLQNCPAFYSSGYGSITYTLQNCVCKNAGLIGFHSGNASGTYTFTITGITVVDGGILANGAYGTFFIRMENINWYGYLSNDYSAVGLCRGQVIVKNLVGFHNVSGRRMVLAGGKADNAVFINCSLSGYGNGLGQDGAADCKYINCSLGNAYNPIIQNHLSGISEIINLTTNAYYRPTLRLSQVANQLWTNRIIVKGLTVAGNSHPKAFEHLFPHGFVKNRWDAATPDYTTFDFRLQQASFAGQPLWLEYQVFTSDPIRVTGTITQLGTGESVKIQIFSAGKEPLYGDTPDFEQTYTATGDISVNWTPTDKRTWVIRVLAYLQQTTNPITIQNLQVAGGGTGGGDTYNINVSDSVAPTLQDSGQINASLNVSESLAPTLQDSGQVSASLSVTDSLAPILQDSGQVNMDLGVQDSIAPTLQDSGQVSVSLGVTDSLAPTLQDSGQISVSLSLSDNIAPTLQESVANNVSLSSTENINVTLTENLGVNTSVSADDSINTTLSDNVTVSNTLSVSDTVAPTLQEEVNVTSGTLVALEVTDTVSPNLAENLVTNVAVVATDSVGATLNDNAAISNVLSVSDTIAPTLQDEANITSSSLITLEVTDTVSPNLVEDLTTNVVVAATDGISTTLSDSATSTAQISPTDLLNVTLLENVSTGATLQVSDQVVPNLSDISSVAASIAATDQISTTIQENPTVTANLSAADNISPTLTDEVTVWSGQLYEISVSDGISPTLAEEANINAQISPSDTISATLSDSAATTASLSLTDTITPTLSDTSSTGVNVALQEAISPTLSEAVSTAAQMAIAENLNLTLQDTASTTFSASVSEVIQPTIQDAASAFATLAVSESLQPTLQETTYTDLSVTTSETIQPVLSDNVGIAHTIAMSEAIQPLLSEAITSSVSIAPEDIINAQIEDTATATLDISATDEIRPTLQEGVVLPTTVSVSEAIQSGLAEQVATEAQITVSTEVRPTLTDEARIMGGVLQVYEPLDLEAMEETLSIEIEPEEQTITLEIDED